MVGRKSRGFADRKRVSRSLDSLCYKGYTMSASGPGRFKSLSEAGSGSPPAYLLYNFDPNQADLKPEHESALRETVGGILANGRSQVTLVGRAARSESLGSDIGLSSERADAVARFLQSIRISPAQIHVQARGEPFGFPAPNAEEDRAVQIFPTVAKDFVLGVRRQTKVPGVKWSAVEQTIRSAMGPLVEQAGRSLQLSAGAGSTADVAITLTDAPQQMRPCEGVLFLGIEGGGLVFVDAHTQLRVCGGSKPLELLFGRDDVELAHAIGNTAVHEIAHTLASLDHVPDTSNFLYGLPGTGANLPPAQRTRETLRKHFGGRKTFNEEQRKALVDAIASGYYSGGERIR